ETARRSGERGDREPVRRVQSGAGGHQAVCQGRGGGGAELFSAGRPVGRGRGGGGGGDPAAAARGRWAAGSRWRRRGGGDGEFQCECGRCAEFRGGGGGGERHAAAGGAAGDAGELGFWRLGLL